MKKVSTTQFRYETKRFINDVVNKRKPITLTVYGKPQAVVLPINLVREVDQNKYGKQKQTKKLTKEQMKKFIITDGKKMNTTKLISEWRDEE